MPIWIWRAAGTGILAFVTPRFLEGVGVPLARWSTMIGEITGTSVELISWAALIVFGLLLFGIETWKQPIGRLWKTFGPTDRVLNRIGHDIELNQLAKLVQKARDDQKSIHSHVNVERERIEVHPKVNQIDTYIDFNLPILNRTVFNIAIRNISGRIAFQKNSLAQPPNLIDPELKIMAGRRGTIKIRQPVSEAVANIIRESSLQDIKKDLSDNSQVDIHYAFVNINGDEQEGVANAQLQNLYEVP